MKNVNNICHNKLIKFLKQSFQEISTSQERMQIAGVRHGGGHGRVGEWKRRLLQTIRTNAKWLCLKKQDARLTSPRGSGWPVVGGLVAPPLQLHAAICWPHMLTRGVRLYTSGILNAFNITCSTDNALGALFSHLFRICKPIL